MVCIDTIATGENIRKALQAAGKTTADVRDECGFTSTERHSQRLTIAECHVHSFRMGVGECDKIFSV